jgi:hypothetical protein
LRENNNLRQAPTHTQAPSHARNTAMTTTEAAPKSLGENLGKRLTHVDAAVREKTIHLLGAWMRDREKQVGVIDPVEMLQLWKSLHYTMWMTDKVPVQQHMSDALSTLSTSFRREANVTAYFVAFFATLRREWTLIDYLRLDKYLSLVRRMVHEWILHVATQSWSGEAIDAFAVALRDHVLLPVQPDGLRMHVCFVFLTELRRVGGALLAGSVLHELLSPFFCVLISPPSEPMFKATVDDVFVVRGRMRVCLCVRAYAGLTKSVGAARQVCPSAGRGRDGRFRAVQGPRRGAAGGHAVRARGRCAWGHGAAPQAALRPSPKIQGVGPDVGS